MATILKTEVLVKFMEKECGEIKYCRKVGLDFITNFASSKFDDLCDWTYNIVGVQNIYVGQCKC